MGIAGGTTLGTWLGTFLLCNRELEVLRLLARGKSNLAISGLLSITEGTVKFHVNNILTKLDVGDRTQAVIVALQHGLVRLD